jgi:hypothetical protein
VRQFRRVVRIVAGRGGEQTGTGRRWSPPLADRVLLIAMYYRTNLTMLQSVHAILKRSIRQAQARDRVTRNVAELVTTPKGKAGAGIRTEEARALRWDHVVA